MAGLQSRRVFSASLLVGAAGLGASLPVAAAFPDRPVVLVIPFAAGGSADTVGRVLAERLGPLLGQGGIAVVENKPGAGGILAAEHVRRARADGYTLLIGSASVLAVGPVAQPATYHYDPIEDFTPIALLGAGALGLVVHDAKGPRTPQELAHLLRERSGGLSYASAGVGTISHLAGALFARAAEGRALHVPYRGGGSLAEAVLKGEVDYAIDPLGSVAGPIQGGGIRLLAVTTPVRDPTFPEAPTLREAGMPDFALTTWAALVGPRGIPSEVTQALGAAANAAVREPAVRSRLLAAGFGPVADGSPTATRTFIAAELARFRALAADIGLQAG